MHFRNELSAPISTHVPWLKKCFSTERRDEHAALLWHGLLPSSRDDARFIYNRSLLLLHHNPSWYPAMSALSKVAVIGGGQMGLGIAFVNFVRRVKQD
jgi:hypothetical protein